MKVTKVKKGFFLIEDVKVWVDEINNFFSKDNSSKLSKELILDLKMRMLAYKASDYLFQHQLHNEDKSLQYVNIKIPNEEVESITSNGFEASVATVFINDEEIRVFAKVDK